MTNETFTFETLGELRDFLNTFKTTDLDTYYFNSSDYITLALIESPMGDGSSVTNVEIFNS